MNKKLKNTTDRIKRGSKVLAQKAAGAYKSFATSGFAKQAASADPFFNTSISSSGDTGYGYGGGTGLGSGNGFFDMPGLGGSSQPRAISRPRRQRTQIRYITRPRRRVSRQRIVYRYIR